MSQNKTRFFRSYFKLTTCFGPCCWPSSVYKSIYLRKLYSIIIKYVNLKLLLFIPQNFQTNISTYPISLNYITCVY